MSCIRERINDMMVEISTLKIEFFVPEAFIDPIRHALAELDVGHIGNYDHCVSITDVRGYWRPLIGASPHAGEIGQISCGSECKVEVNCPSDLAVDAIETIRKNHPYDEPLINVIPLLNEQFGGTF